MLINYQQGGRIMSSTHKRILNLIVILGLLLVMLPQQGSIAQADVSNPVSPNQPDDSEEIFRQPYAGPERELDNTIQAGDKILNIAGWNFYPYFEQCEGRFRGEGSGKIGLKGTLSEWCYITYPVLLPYGSTIEWVFFNYYDADPDRDLRFRITKYPYLGDEAGTIIVEGSSSGASGYGYTPGIRVNHKMGMYDTYQILIMFPPGANNDLLFSSVNIRYSEPPPALFGLGFPAIQK